MGRFWEEAEQQFKEVITKTVDAPLGPSTGSQDEQEIRSVIYGPAVMKRWNDNFADAARLAASHPNSVYARRVALLRFYSWKPRRASLP